MSPTELQDLLRRYHHGTCTPAETRAVEAWYAAQPDGPPPALSAAERAALQQRLWQRLAPAAPPRRLLGPAQPAAWQWVAAAAAVAVGVGVGSRWLAPGPPAGAPTAVAQPWQVQRNATARPQTVQLPDGSRATLQPASQLRFHPGFAGGRRTVYLTGEAFFKVTRDTARPFRVFTADMETRVLGTSFTVQAYPAQAETVVRVRTGQVRVSPLASARGPKTALPAAVLLRPNQQAVYAPARQQLHRELIAQPVLLAPHPFAFDDRPVAEVLEALKTAYGVDIQYSAAAVAGCTVNLTLRHQTSLFGKLDVLCQATGASYTQDDAQIRFTSSGCQPI